MDATFRPASDQVPLPAAAGRLADLGFISGPDLPDRPGPAFLMVALRDHPTLRHYDPERIDFWVSRSGRGVRRSLTRATPMPLDLDVSWGMIQLLDRFPVTNEYLTFGGHLSAAQVDGSTIAVFTSPVPLLRRGGHSQIWDEGSDELAVFFARLVAAVDIHPELESWVAAADPFVRYAAFLADVVGRYRASPELRSIENRTWTLLQAEEALMRREHPAALRAGGAIVAAMRNARLLRS
jgi:hypothetical protein